jgi:UDP-N-acetylmuramate dehydrogenase
MELSYNVSLKSYNTFGIDVKAEKFACIASTEDVLKAISIIDNQPLLILGGGSNLLFTKDFPGLVLLNQLKGFEICEETDNHSWVKSGAGENWHSFVIQCI